MNKLKTTIASMCLLASAGVNADIIGGTVEISLWHAGLDGTTNSGPASSEIDFEDDLNFEREPFVEIAASFEHPIPLLPNVRVRHTSLAMDETSGTISLPTGTLFGSVPSGDVTSEIDLTHYDGVLYYEILDNWIVADIGLNIKKFDGEFRVTATGGGTAETRATIDEVLPLPYARAELELPFTGLALGAEVAGISYDDNAFYDAKIRLRQNISLAFLELGYRQIAIRLEDLGADNIDIDADFGGLYFSTGVDF